MPEPGNSLEMFNQLWLALILVIPMVLISRTVVAGTRYSPILIIVIFGLIMGYLLVASGVATPGLPEFLLIDFIAKVTIIALIASFFVGGQELRKIFGGMKLDPDDMVVPSTAEVVLGTNNTQLFYLVRAVFVFLGIEGLSRILIGVYAADPLSQFYPLVSYIGIVGAVILIDPKATVKNKSLYIRKGVAEMAGIVAVLYFSFNIALWIRPVIALPQIFFAMILSALLGAVLYRWTFGPTIRSLLFAGIPVVLAANFLVGGSRIAEAFRLTEMYSVMAYGFFGQLFWMFGGIALLILLGKANAVRILAPGMAGGLSHSGLTGACTAGDLGARAALRAPIMINVPFFGHIFVFSILAVSAQHERLLVGWSFLVFAAGVIITALAFRTLSRADGNDTKEVNGLMLFSFGWQITAVFGGFLLLAAAQIPFEFTAMAQSSALSHFGLFAAIQGGMFGETSAQLIPFVFAMPFLVHPLVFTMFGRAMQNDGVMPARVVCVFAITGLIGLLYALFLL